MTTGYIYQLVCSVKKEPIYIGATIRSTKVRMFGHMTKINIGNEPLYRYLRDVGVAPTIEVIETLQVSGKYSKKIKVAERKWIKKKRRDGFAILNVMLPNPKRVSNLEIRILARPMVYETIARLAFESGRTMAKQADYMLMKYIEQNKL